MTEDKIMTPAEFAEAMKDIRDYDSGYGQGYNKEIRHVSMDSLMCNILRQLGYDEGIDIFEKTSKWYA